MEDVAYVHHGDKPLLISFSRPRRTGFFPFMVKLHGGA